MKKLIKMIAVTAVLALAAVSLAACGGNSNTQSKTESAASGTQSATESASADLSKVDISIVEGDFAAMESFAKALQNGEYEGKVVKATGINSRSNFGAKASVMTDDGSGKKIGTTYIITGVDSIDGYPENDAVIQITGVVTKSDNGISCHIEVPSDQVVVK